MHKFKAVGVAVCLIGAGHCAEEAAQPSVLDSFYPQLRDSDRVWVRADLLYFVPHEERIAMTNKETDLFTTADVTLEPVVKPHFEWDCGYRFGLGYIFSNRLWDFELNWTHYQAHTKQSRSTAGNIQFGMFPIWSLSDDILQYDWVSSAKMRWKLKMDLVDLDFGRPFSMGKKFFVRPIFGLRTAWIDQELDVAYSGGIFANGLNLADLDGTFGPDFIHMRNDFWGIGPLVGLEPQLNLIKGLRIYGSVSGTADYGYFTVHQRETYLKNVRYYHHSHPTGVRWMLDASAGLMWKTFCVQSRFALTFKLGWEYHLFFDQLELKGDAFGLISGNRNLSLNGAAFSGRFDF